MNLPIMGVPLFQGRTKQAYFSEIEAKFKKKTAGWRGRLLSFGGKITLIRSALTSLPIHALFIRVHSFFLWKQHPLGKQQTWGSPSLQNLPL